MGYPNKYQKNEKGRGNKRNKMLDMDFDSLLTQLVSTKEKIKNNNEPKRKFNGTREPKSSLQPDEEVEATLESLIKIDTPEDLEKWIAERKRNFPTAANVKRKEEEKLRIKNIKISELKIEKKKTNQLGLVYSSSDGSGDEAEGDESKKEEEIKIEGTESDLSAKKSRITVDKVGTDAEYSLYGKLQDQDYKKDAPKLLQLLRLLYLQNK